MIVDFELVGQPCYPVNRREISLEINHDQESIINQPRPHVGINNLYFSREDIFKVMSYLENPPGITEGAPFNIKITERGIQEVIKMYIDCMDNFKRSNDGISASVKMLNSLDWLDDRIDGFTFESMYNETGMASFTIDGIAYSSYQDFFDKRCIYIPYVLSTIPNRQDAFMTLFSMSYIIIQLSQGIKQFIQWCTPIAGVMPSVGIAQVVWEIVFFVAMLVALIALINHLFNCLVQPVKYHGAMLLIDMLKIVSFKLGLKFNSSIWDIPPYNQIAYLPEKYNPIIEANPIQNNIFGIAFAGFAKTGFTSPGYSTGTPHDSMNPTTIQKGYMTGTGGDIFRLVKKICNGKIIIPDQTTDLVLERRDYYPSGTPYQLPDIRQDWNGYNTDELTANILIRFSDDLNDKNCIDKYIGTILQATHSQIITNDIRLVMLKGLREIQIAAARGIRKDTTSFIEDIYIALIPAFNAIHNAGIAVINAAIDVMNLLIGVIDLLITFFNIMMDILITVANIIITIVNAINDIINIVGGNSIGSGNISTIPWVPLNNNWVHSIPHRPYSPISSVYTSRVGALLLENDMVNTPKLLLVDTSRPEFIASGGFSGQQRIAYLQTANQTVINAQWLWDHFYFIDAFVGSPNNRFTKISPALNKDSEKNPFILSVADFKNLVSNPKLKDNFAETIIADTINWRIGDESGRAEIEFRKAGWLKNPQSNNGAVRAQEVNINLQIKTSLPNGQ